MVFLDNSSINAYLDLDLLEVYTMTTPPDLLSDGERNFKTKAEAVLDAIREGEVGTDVTIFNEDMSVFCILTIKCKEHPEKAR